VVRIGVALPAGNDLGPNAVDHLVARSREAQAAGLGAVWFSQRFDHDALSVAAVVAATVPGIGVGTSVVPIHPRHPLVVAAQAQTAQAAGPGRFTLGLGLGAPDLLRAGYGITVPRPIRHLRDYLTVLASVLRTGHADVQSETVTARTPRSAAVPGSTPPPVLVAAMGPQALRATGELADGTLPFLAGPRTVAEFIVPTITEAAQRAGRPAPQIVVAVPVIVTDAVAEATARARAELAFYDTIPSYRAILAREGVDRAADLAVIGDEEHVAEALAGYAAAGATQLVAAQTALHDEAARVRTWRLLGQLSTG
jgi:F420-dependent oxidoreductase-like protein